MKILKSIITLFLMFAVLSLTACPKAEKTLRTLRESSAQMDIYGEKIVQANIDAFQAKEISPELFRDLTTLTGKFRDGLKVYREALTTAENTYKNTKDLPAGTINKLSKLLDVQVIQIFLDLTEKLNLVTGSQAQTIQNIVASIRLTILTIQGAFSEVRQMQLQGANV